MGRRHGGKGAGRSRSIRRRISANKAGQSSGDSDFRQLKGDMAAVAHDLGADLDPPLIGVAAQARKVASD